MWIMRYYYCTKNLHLFQINLKTLQIVILSKLSHKSKLKRQGKKNLVEKFSQNDLSSFLLHNISLQSQLHEPVLVSNSMGDTSKLALIMPIRKKTVLCVKIHMHVVLFTYAQLLGWLKSFSTLQKNPMELLGQSNTNFGVSLVVQWERICLQCRSGSGRSLEQKMGPTFPTKVEKGKIFILPAPCKMECGQ